MHSPQPASSFAYSQEEILADLERVGLLRNHADIVLTPLLGNPRRRDNLERRSFMVSQGQTFFCHLTVGTDMERLWASTEAFYQACPAIACKPLFFEKGLRQQYLAREFISGQTVDHLVRTCAISAERAREHAAKVQLSLDDTLSASTIAAAKAEARAVLDQLQRLPTLSVIDRAVFREVIAPAIDRGIETIQPRTRWTNGDFTPHNLIIGSIGDARLIDYEFAARTHFFSEDDWRWRAFSESQIDLNLPADASPPEGEIPPWLQIFFWAKQLVLSHETILPELASTDAIHTFARIVALAGVAGVPLESSFFPHAAKLDAQLHSELARLKIERHELADKIVRMHASRSWRWTAWLRAIRRWQKK